MGKTEGVGPYVDRLLAIEPLHPMSHFTAWLVKVMAGKFAPALELIKNAYGSCPDDRLIQWGYAQSLVYCGLYDQAFQEMD
jgi:predicted Zn-dependent protease